MQRQSYLKYIFVLLLILVAIVNQNGSGNVGIRYELRSINARNLSENVGNFSSNNSGKNR